MGWELWGQEVKEANDQRDWRRLHNLVALYLDEVDDCDGSVLADAAENLRLRAVYDHRAAGPTAPVVKQVKE